MIEMSGTPAIELAGISAGYDSAPVLTEVNLRVAPGEFLAVLGPNGGGKSTLLRVILGLLPPRSGRVHVLGQCPRRSRHLMGYLPQYTHHDEDFPITAQDVVAMGLLRPGLRPQPLRRSEHNAVRVALERTGVCDLARRRIGELSGGQRQRVLLARALVAHPSVLVLDEPTAGLDPSSTERLHADLEQLRGRTTVLMVSHDQHAAAGLATRMVQVAGGVESCMPLPVGSGGA